jgi:hypothetical protein
MVMVGTQGNSSTAALLPALSTGAVLRRVRDMALLWLVFGGACGACSEPARSGNLIGIASGVLAGMIVLPFLGVFLGLVGGRIAPTFLGGCFGGAFAGGLGLALGALTPLHLASFGIILGGLAGGTLGAVVWWVNLLARGLGPMTTRLKRS